MLRATRALTIINCLYSVFTWLCMILVIIFSGAGFTNLYMLMILLSAILFDYIFLFEIGALVFSVICRFVDKKAGRYLTANLIALAMMAFIVLLFILLRESAI